MNEELVFADKPVGLSTHSPDPKIMGFVEYLEWKTATKLLVCHRLDKETSGVIVFAKNKIAAATLAKLFEEQQVNKKYLLVTDRQVPHADQIETSSEIKKVGNKFVSIKNQNPNSKTIFQRVVTFENYALWAAFPQTGKPHQIRLHAADLGMPVLGDFEHGGSVFPRLMLHAQEISFAYQGQKYLHRSQEPKIFQDLRLLKDITTVSYQIGIDRCQRLFNLTDPLQNTYRLIHKIGGGLRCDLLGKYLWFYWYHQQLPEREDLNRIIQLAKELDASGWKVQLMENRGKVPLATQNLCTIEADTWIAQEQGVNYVFKREQGYSPGLFLDQRQNRLWVRKNSQGKRVLNLFCYTAGFSVCGALGGATQVVSVDTSKATLEWGRENFRANNLDDQKYEFWAADARYFLAGAKKKQRQFDLIICDPPSFARNKQGVFKLERDYQQLLTEIYAILAKQGVLLFSLNLEKWTMEKLQQEIKNLRLPGLKVVSVPRADLDYELPGEEPVMKSLLITKSS